jgi:restriction system protein
MPERIPLPHGFFDPVLRVLAEHPEGLPRSEVQRDRVADLLGLTAEQRSERVSDGGHFTYKHRIGWALTMLKHAGLVENQSRGVWRITSTGRTLLAARPSGLTDADRREIAAKSRARGSDETNEAAADPQPANDLATPEELILAAVAVLRKEVSSELLDQIASCSPAFFEALVLDLLHALGYGTSRSDLQRVGGSGDGGIDGIIALDKLGLEKVYVQAKRWQNNVGRPELQGFFGALSGRRARKGVFITTSGFTREAREFAESVSDSIVLVDGALLTSLMIDHKVGVSHGRQIALPTVDTDYFSDA